MSKSYIKIFICFYLISILSANFNNVSIDLNNKLNSINNSRTFTHIIGIMVDFSLEENDDPLTSGNGKFIEQEDVNFINYNNISRCNSETHFLLDPPPHNENYFSSQIKATQNYFSSISNGQINFDFTMLDGAYHLSNYMREYAYSENHLSLLFVESLELASNDIDIYMSDNNLTFDDVIFVVFHAGLGQDISAGIFDPTIYDIHSAFIDSNMLDNLDDSNLININNQICQNEICWVYENNISNGILLPETLNMVYYDVIEDVLPVTFVNNEDLENIYCDSQYGITGLFSYLLGFAYGLPPMHNIENGFTRIGKFGLMDQGSFNGRGIVPALPNPWTRINFLSSNLINITDSLLNLDYDLEIEKRTTIDNIYRIDISDGEYFLLEHSNNTFLFDNQITSISEIISDSLNNENADDVYWLDILNLINAVDVNSETGVIESILNYDYAMPGSGVLIWHIIEPDIDEYYLGMNNDLEDRSIQLKEGDGIINIGYLNPYPGLLSQEVTTGYYDDYWYADNQTYKNVNNSNSNVVFNNTSIPNSNTSSNINSFIAMQINTDIQNVMNLSLAFDTPFETEVISQNFNNFMGNNGNDCVYYFGIDSFVYEKCNDVIRNMVSMDFVSNPNLSIVDENYRILYYEGQIYLVENDLYYIDPNDGIIKNYSEFYINPYGYYDNLDSDYAEEINFDNTNFSLGDIDQDGLDEIVAVNNGILNIINANGTTLNGFPMQQDFYDIPIIVDIIEDEFNYPEIICKNGNKISFISHSGSVLYELPLYDNNEKLFIISDYENDIMNLYNGNRTFSLNIINDNGFYWPNPNSTTFNYPIVQGPSIYDRRILFNQLIEEQIDKGIDINKVYNYPNPFSSNTTFRFYVANSNSITIKIYDVTGFLISNLSIQDLVHNEYNEILWDSSFLKPGLYFAEIKSDLNESKLIKMIIQ